jgi:hypothetical protein
MKNQETVLYKCPAKETADRLSKGMGKPLAKKLAEHTAKLLGAIDGTDVNPEVATIKHIRKQTRFWTEVAFILAK